MQRLSFPLGHASSRGPTSRKPGTKDADSKGLWLSMLDDVSRGKELAEKQLIILGGTPTQQREFLNTLHPPSSSNRPRRPNDRHNNTKFTRIPISNRFALGYTYHDVLDTDDEDILARLSIYMLSNPSGAFASLLKPLLTAKTVPNTLVTILLNWDDVFRWPRELRQWIRVLRSVVGSLDDDAKIAMEEVMEGWKEKRVGVDGVATMGMSKVEGGTASEAKTPVVPLGPGEWEDELGVPLAVVCLNAEKQEKLEKEYGWQEVDFDFVLQWMRCVLLKPILDGASLIYTPSFDSNNVRTLIHNSLGIHSLLKRETVKHNAIDRDKILIPTNWDSWGKIRVLKEDFDMETIANAWSIEIQSPPDAEFDPSPSSTNGTQTKPDAKRGSEQETTISLFTSSLPNPFTTSSSTRYNPSPASALSDTVTVQDTQSFLAEQAQILESLRAEDEREAGGKRGTNAAAAIPATGVGVGIGSTMNDETVLGRAERERERAPLNINVGGIQVDAEEITRRIREREADRDRDRDRERESGGGVRTPKRDVVSTSSGSGIATPDGTGTGTGSGVVPGTGTATPGKMPNEALASYFAGLMKKAKGAAGSAESPRGSGSGSGEK